MKGASAVTALFLTVLCVGCSDRSSPAGPSSVRADSLPANSAAGQAAGQGASVSPTPAAAKVPFKGTFEGSQTTTPLEPPLAFSVVSASGTATLLGRFTLEIPHTVNFATRTGDGTYTFTAANGDTVTANFTGTADTSTPIFAIEEHATITGGTGRFAGAAGTFTAHRLFDPVNGTTTGSFEGTISAPGAGKS
jgi:hypothetical protein